MWLNLIDDETLRNTEFIYNLSYGKDSMAGLHVTIDILGIPVSRIVHAEVWATDTIPADLPPMVEFKRWADGYIKGRWGLTVEHVYATRGGYCEHTPKHSTSCTSEESTSASYEASQCRKAPGAKIDSSGTLSNKEKLTYEKIFYRKRQPKSGGVHTMYGFPTKWGPWCNSDLKRAALERSRAFRPCGANTAQENSNGVLWIPDLGQPGQLVHSTQNESFLLAPGNEGRREISCICWVSLPMNRNVWLGI